MQLLGVLIVLLLLFGAPILCFASLVAVCVGVSRLRQRRWRNAVAILVVALVVGLPTGSITYVIYAPPSWPGNPRFGVTHESSD